MTKVCKHHRFETAQGKVIQCSAADIAAATGAGITLIRRRLAGLQPGEALRAVDVAPASPGGQTKLGRGSIALALAGASLPFERWGELPRRQQSLQMGEPE